MFKFVSQSQTTIQIVSFSQSSNKQQEHFLMKSTDTTCSNPSHICTITQPTSPSNHSNPPPRVRNN